jgi:hypothetical protein
MIGGCDVTIASSAGIEDLVHHAAEVILGIWTDGVIEAADVENKLLQLPDLFGATEVFVYRNLDSQRSWTEHGWTKGNCMSMIHLLSSIDDGMITCVLEDQHDPELARILEAIRAKLQASAISAVDGKKTYE